MRYGFKISMLLTFNLLLVSTLITCLLIIFVCFKPHDLIPLFSAKHALLLLQIYEVVAILNTYKRYSIKGRKLIFVVLNRLVNCLCKNIEN